LISNDFAACPAFLSGAFPPWFTTGTVWLGFVANLRHQRVRGREHRLAAFDVNLGESVHTLASKTMIDFNTSANKKIRRSKRLCY
jgi:hypothetical protein